MGCVSLDGLVVFVELVDEVLIEKELVDEEEI